MDPPPTPEQQAFRDELRTWLHENLPWEYGTGRPPQFDDLTAEGGVLRDREGGRAGGGAAGGSAWRVRPSTAAAAPGRSSTSSSRRSWPARVPPSSSAAS